MPSTVVFTGHMVDRPGRAAPRFPPSLAPEIAQRIAEELEIAGATDGFASGACGGDILFLEAIMARGGRAHVTLPCAVGAFRKDCVDIIPGADWAARFDRILELASSVEILGEQYASDNAMASECCSRVMAGLAARCAQEKSEQPIVLALWDGKPGDAVGGTHSCVQFCIQNGYQVRLMMDLAPGATAETREVSPPTAGTSSAIKHATVINEATQQICAVIFADAVGFSRLREREVPGFARQYLGCAMQSLQTHEIVPLVKNTWGDGLYLVFESVREAGQFAVDFRDRILATDWRKLGFSCDMSVRIAVHAGPLYRIYDPVIGQWSFTGSHVTKAARMEPSADPGRVFASIAFVALAAAERVTEFTCHPVGRRQLVKGAGELAVFELVDAEKGN
jgi:class 3 adenylate cyclase